MFAVIKTGGKQYRVEAGDEIKIEKLGQAEGDVVSLGEVLMLGGEGGETVVGSPLVDGAQVIGEVLGDERGKKIIVFKKRRRQNYRRTKGHRQWSSRVRIAEIVAPGQTAKTKLKSSTAAPKTTKKAEAEKPAAKKAAPKAAETKAAAPKADAKKAAPKAAPKAAAKADDLTELTGVGPALAKKLNEAGVTTFAQVAAWTDADMDTLSETITGLKAKAEKGDWIKAAKALAK